jgi:hypothetical protein
VTHTKPGSRGGLRATTAAGLLLALALTGCAAETNDTGPAASEAAAYLSGPVGFTLSAKLVPDLRYLDRGPVVEKRGSRLVYRKSALDAFLTEYLREGCQQLEWHAGEDFGNIVEGHPQ